ncbi:MAG TPA: Asp-tRNA(Asn)/Glu-tRNA(Gln) amidotransferase subunit GatA [Nitrospirae bacterium]|nr:Asp-tRNA(Asn)/Glu-tRNA(Gln) amidotransferase subunit GatA [Nitrospirota bacterium]
MELFRLGISEALDLLEKDEISSREILDSVFSRIEAVDDRVRSFVSLTRDRAYDRMEDLKGSEKRGLLSGIPLAIKDNICIKGIQTTCASKILEGFLPPYESYVTERLFKSGYILIGKTNLDEFAMGSSTENSGYFVTHNPWDLERVPGGSSGGSAAAVAADECLGALGSDTGGSIRQPAAFCGVVGFKPTYGRVSRYGLVAFASSFDQIGPITKNVKDAALLLNVISGRDPMDSTSVPVEVPDFTAGLDREIKGLKVGVPKEYFIEGLDPEVELGVRDAAGVLERLGAEIVEVSLPHTGYAVAAYYILATSEASSNLARFDGVKYGFRAEGKDLIDMYMETRAQGFGPEVKRRIMLGAYALSAGYYDAYYKKAQQVRTLIKTDFEETFKNVDVIVTPTSPSAAFRIGDKVSDPLQMYLSDIFTISVNLAGVPAISIPCGYTSEGLPIGFQVIGKHFDEETVLRVSYAYEQSTDWHKKRPGL